MPTLLEQIQSLRQERRYEKACELANELIGLDEKNADAWWNLALAQHSLGRFEDSITNLKTVLKLVPKFAAGWAQYGVVLAANQQIEQGLKALSHALHLDPDHAFAARQAARICREENDLEREIQFLAQLDMMGQANGDDLNHLGIAYWEKGYFSKAIEFYHRSAAALKSCAPYFNLAIVYNHAEVSQDVDAVDCLERALEINPAYQKATARLTTIKPRLEELAGNVLRDGEVALPKESWYQFYVNPFELLVGRNYDHDLDAYDAKQIQKLKRRVIQEIELEDGEIHYVEGLSIDKSRAIGICEELNDTDLKHYHWIVFSEPHLLGFLTRGDIRHFLCLKEYKPLRLLAELDSKRSGFRAWLSTVFVRQYNVVLSRALQDRRVPLLEALFDGRRWTLREHEERCFESAKRQVDHCLVPLRQAAALAEEVKPTISEMATILEHSGLMAIINLLPQPFRDQQYEAVSLIREIAIAAFNIHGDTDLSKAILSFSRKFNFKSATLTQRLEDDFKQIEKLISQERQHEAKLKLGEDKLEITKEGVRQGSVFLDANSVTTIRWGVVITGAQNGRLYQFLMVCRDNEGNETKFSWQSSSNLEEQQKNFGSLVNAALNYIVPNIYERIRSQLDAGKQVRVGACRLQKDFLMFEKSGWFTSKVISIPWARVSANINNGVLSIFDLGNPRLRIEMSIRDTENAVILQLLASIRNK